MYTSYLNVMRRLGHYRWFSLFMKHVGCQADRAMIKLTRGRLSMSGPALPTLLLTTTGRRTGKDRTVPLLYVRDADNLVVACENFGLSTASSWPANLFADPNVRIEIGAASATYRGRLATDEEADRNMPRLIALWPGHDTYLERSGTRRVFVFEPS